MKTARNGGDVAITFRAPPALAEVIQAHADANGVERATWLRVFLTAFALVYGERIVMLAELSKTIAQAPPIPQA